MFWILTDPMVNGDNGWWVSGEPQIYIATNLITENGYWSWFGGKSIFGISTDTGSLSAENRELAFNLISDLGAVWGATGAYWPYIDRNVTSGTPADITANRDWSAFDADVEENLEHNQTTIIEIFGYAEWASGSTSGWFVPADVSDFGDFCEDVVEHCEANWPGQIIYYSIWNEPNIGTEFWSGLSQGNVIWNHNPSAEVYGVETEPSCWMAWDNAAGSTGHGYSVSGMPGFGPHCLHFTYQGTAGDDASYHHFVRVMNLKTGLEDGVPYAHAFHPGDTASAGFYVRGSKANAGDAVIEIVALDLDGGGSPNNWPDGLGHSTTTITLTNEWQWVTAQYVNLPAGTEACAVAIRVSDLTPTSTVDILVDAARLVDGSVLGTYGSGRAPEWSDPVHYSQLLREAYLHIKTANPNAQVAGFVTNRNDLMFLQDCYQYIKSLEDASSNNNFFDILDVHPYADNRSPDDNDSNFVWWNGLLDRNFCGLSKMYDELETQGDGDKNIICSEFGWWTEARWVGDTDFVSEALQAQYLTLAYEMARDWPWLLGLMWYGLFNDSGSEIPYSLINGDWSHKLSYDAYKLAPKYSISYPFTSEYDNSYQLSPSGLPATASGEPFVLYVGYTSSPWEETTSGVNSLAFYCDDVAPAISGSYFSADVDGYLETSDGTTYASGDIILCAVSATDEHSGVLYIVLYINGEEVERTTFVPTEANTDCTFSINTRDYPNGETSILLVVYDKAGNKAECSDTITIYNTTQEINQEEIPQDGRV